MGENGEGCDARSLSRRGLFLRFRDSALIVLLVAGVIGLQVLAFASKRPRTSLHWYRTEQYSVEALVGDDWVWAAQQGVWTEKKRPEQGIRLDLTVHVEIERPVPRHGSRSRLKYGSSPTTEELEQARPERGVRVRISGFAPDAPGFEGYVWQKGGPGPIPDYRPLPASIVERVLPSAAEVIAEITGDLELAEIVRQGGRDRPEVDGVN